MLAAHVVIEFKIRHPDVTTAKVATEAARGEVAVVRVPRVPAIGTCATVGCSEGAGEGIVPPATLAVLAKVI